MIDETSSESLSNTWQNMDLELIERARKLTALFAEQAADAETLRRPTDEVINAVRDAGIFDLMSPKIYGGREADLDTFFEVGMALSRGDASMAWVCNFYIEHVFLFSLYNEDFQKEIFDRGPHTLAPAVIAPTGKAAPVEGGYNLSGRWQWGTGIMHADWVLITAPLLDEELGQPIPHLFALPKDDVSVNDVWFVDGMCGTGSNDIIVNEVFVPEHRVLSTFGSLNGKSPGAELHKGPLYRTPMLAVLILAATMPALGQTQTAVENFRKLLETKIKFADPDQATHATRPSRQIRLAKVQLEVKQAELLLRNLVESVMEKRNLAEINDRAQWAATYAFVVNSCRDILSQIQEASGATAHFRTEPLQRAVRDINTLSCHIAFDYEQTLENYGRTSLGLDHSTGMV